MGSAVVDFLGTLTGLKKPKVPQLQLPEPPAPVPAPPPVAPPAPAAAPVTEEDAVQRSAAAERARQRALRRRRQSTFFGSPLAPGSAPGATGRSVLGN
jgi:hypothetical protein